jgi:hypothetical protein
MDLASDLTAYIYLELCYNERIRHDFGRLVRENWSADDFVTMNDVRLKARGRQQRLRGLKHRQHRPDLVICDDMENDANAKSLERNRDLLRWIKTAVLGCIDVGGNLFILGTPLGRKGALHTMVTSSAEPWVHWERKVYRAITADGESLWPDKFPLAVLHEQKR